MMCIPYSARRAFPGNTGHILQNGSVSVSFWGGRTLTVGKNSYSLIALKEFFLGRIARNANEAATIKLFYTRWDESSLLLEEYSYFTQLLSWAREFFTDCTLLLCWW